MTKKVKIKEPYIDKYGDIRYNDFEKVVIHPQQKINKMEKRFTQGEWRKGTYSGVVGCPIMAQPDKAKNQFNICSVHGGETIDEVNANAKLIAAAPDMINFLLKIKENEYLSKELEAFFEDELSSIIKSATT